jgi:hypothetical protein
MAMHGNFDWGPFVYGVLAMLVGLLFAFSSRFSSFALSYDGRGVVWSRLFGDRIKTRYLVSAFAFVVGAGCIYIAFHPDT